VGKNLSFWVEVAGRRTEPYTFSYDAPIVNSVKSNTPDSEGETIVVVGDNFGEALNPLVPVLVDIQGESCLDTSWKKEEGRFLDRPFVECTTPRLTVGFKNVTVSVGGQNTLVPAKQQIFETYCKKDFYGQFEEFCLPCPRPAGPNGLPPPGAICPGRHAEPLPTYGWYKVNLVRNPPKPDVFGGLPTRKYTNKRGIEFLELEPCVMECDDDRDISLYPDPCMPICMQRFAVKCPWERQHRAVPIRCGLYP
jgi:hypothetical protein